MCSQWKCVVCVHVQWDIKGEPVFQMRSNILLEAVGVQEQNVAQCCEVVLQHLTGCHPFFRIKLKHSFKQLDKHQQITDFCGFTGIILMTCEPELKHQRKKSPLKTLNFKLFLFGGFV